jgi:hypothetical protein
MHQDPAECNDCNDRGARDGVDFGTLILTAQTVGLTAGEQ